MKKNLINLKINLNASFKQYILPMLKERYPNIKENDLWLKAWDKIRELNKLEDGN